MELGVDKFSWKVIFVYDATTNDSEAIKALLKEYEATDSEIDWAL